MAIENMESLLTTVDEFVDDENKIVTCKWLSRQLALSVNQARGVLESYIGRGEKQKGGISVVYTIIGKDSNGMCVKVVPGSGLNSAKERLKQVQSTTIYSVQKIKPQSSSILYAAEYDNNRENLHESSRAGGIIYEGAKHLTKEEIKHHTTAQPDGAAESSAGDSKVTSVSKPEKRKTPQQKVNFFAKAKTSPPAVKVEEETREPEKKNESSSTRDTASASKKQKKITGVQAFMTKGKTDPFAKTQTKTKNAVKIKPLDAADFTETKSKKETEPEGGIVKSSSMKNESADSKIAKSSKVGGMENDDDLRIDDIPLEDDDFLTETKPKRKEVDAKKRKESEKQNNKKPEKPKPASKSKKTNRHDSSELPAKKRRRIQEYISSSSEEDDEMNEIPLTPPPVSKPEPHEEEKSPEPASPEKENMDKNASNARNKRKKKVLRTKTFVDDEGCMVTEKSYEYKSCSSGDEETVACSNKVSNGNTAEKKTKFPTVSTAQQKKNTKQSSIMGFFQKK